MLNFHRGGCNTLPAEEHECPIPKVAFYWMQLGINPILKLILLCTSTETADFHRIQTHIFHKNQHFLPLVCLYIKYLG